MTDEHRPHPAVAMGKQRALVWEKVATDEDFFEYLAVLAAVYAKRKYKGNGNVEDNLLLEDFKAWKKKKAEEELADFRKEISSGPQPNSKRTPEAQHTDSPI